MKPAPNSLAILLTCRQIYEEAEGLWIYRVLFNFESAEAILDKLSPLSSSTISKIRYVRVACPTLLLQPLGDEEDVYYRLVWALKLLPGLRLDRLTVLMLYSHQEAYENINGLVKHGNGWRELYFLAGNSEMLGFSRIEVYAAPPYQRQPQPYTWNKMLLERDEGDPGGSVTVYRSTQFGRVGRVLDSSKRQILEQKISSEEDPRDYGVQEDPGLMAEGEKEKELLVVAKRGPNVNILERDEPPYSDEDIRAWSGTMTWAEIRYECVDHIGRAFGDDIHGKYLPVEYDCYSNIDEFEWNPIS